MLTTAFRSHHLIRFTRAQGDSTLVDEFCEFVRPLAKQWQVYHHHHHHLAYYSYHFSKQASNKQASRNLLERQGTFLQPLGQLICRPGGLRIGFRI